MVATRAEPRMGTYSDDVMGYYLEDEEVGQQKDEKPLLASSCWISYSSSTRMRT
jgi:hypothetical protein